MPEQSAGSADGGAGRRTRLVDVRRKDPAAQSRRFDSRRQPDDQRRPQPHLHIRPPQSAGAGIRPDRTALFVGARPRHRRRAESDCRGQQLRMAAHRRLSRRSRLRVLELVAVERRAVRLAEVRRVRRRPAVGAAPARERMEGHVRAAAAHVLHGRPKTTTSRSPAARRSPRAASTIYTARANGIPGWANSDAADRA